MIANKYSRKINGTTATGGDTLVTIVVGKDENSKTYNLSKEALISVSDYFNRAFSGDWVEVASQTVHLEEEDPAMFDLVVQWAYCGRVVINDRKLKRKRDPDDNYSSKSQYISTYLRFLQLADYLQIDGPIETSIEPMRRTITAAEQALQPAHIRTAADLPGGRPIMKMFAEMCAKSYILSRCDWLHHPNARYRNGILSVNMRTPYGRAPSAPRKTSDNSTLSFRFSKELEEIDGFAAELLRCASMDRLIKSAMGRNFGEADARAQLDSMVDP